MFESDDFFAVIIGYTSGGAPYGLTWEEAEALARQDAQLGAEPGLTGSEENGEDEALPF